MGVIQNVNASKRLELLWRQQGVEIFRKFQSAWAFLKGMAKNAATLLVKISGFLVKTFQNAWPTSEHLD